MTANVDTAREIARYLLQAQAVILRPNRPFTWASGWKSPIYCDNRLLLSYPDIRNNVVQHFARHIRENFSGTEVIAGVATAGIAHAAMIAQELDLPMCYIRSSRKGHGTGSQIEGRLQPGQRTVVVEDLISTGGSSIAAAQAAQEVGASVLEVVSIFTYAFPQAEKAFSEAKILSHSLSSFPLLIEEAVESGYVQKDQLQVLERWRQQPESWSPVQ